jgi:eukaryotic-like serine/threonine-protein kinase
MTILGTLIGGRYRLDAEIGRGGMSTVYRAFDTVLERPVAIKVMHREIAADSDQLERFRREARSVAQLNHPHVVTVIDAGEEPSGEGSSQEWAGTPYIVLEYVDGETLKDVIRREAPLDIPQAIAYAIEIARALGAAHERQIVHRDVKPHNVLISSEGGAKITDFGIARTLSEEGLTVAGRVLGTTDYVSPEQALGEPVTGQSDLYSLGVVLYEMLTGEVPFHGDSPVAVAMKHVREDIPDVQQLRPELSAATAAVVDRAVAKDLDRRYKDAASMEADLEDVLAVEASRSGQATGEVTTVLRTLPGRTRRRLPWRMRHPARWVGSLALLAAIAAIALVVAADQTHRGTGVAGGVRSQPGLEAVILSQSAAHDYNPFGTGPENRDQVENVVDSDPNTTWSTEQYYGGNLKKAGGVGLGLYLDAAPAVAGKAIEIETPTPGFAAQVYVANHIDLALEYGSSTPLTARGWQGPVGASADVHSGERIQLKLGGASFRYYLVWMTTLPPASGDGPASEAVGALALAALEREPAETIEQAWIGGARRGDQLRVDARRSEAGHRVELVDQHLLAGHEEVDAGEPVTAAGEEHLDSEIADPAVRARADPRGDLQLHPPGGVLRSVVVEVAGEEDLARLGSAGALAAERDLGARRAEHAALDLAAGGQRLDDHERVVYEGLRQRGSQRGGLADLHDAYRGAEVGGLDEHRQAELGELGEHLLALVLEALLAHTAVGDLGNPDRRHQLFEEHLVEAQRRGGDARADIRHVEQLEQALDGAVLAERPVQRGEGDVRAEQPGGGRHAERRAIAAPYAIAADLDGEHAMARGEQSLADRRARGQRHLVLGGAPARENGDGQRLTRGRQGVDPLTGGVVVVGGGVVVVVVVVVCGLSAATVIVTVAPLRAFAPAAGLCLRTIPTCSGMVVVPASTFGLKPAFSSAF